MRNFAAILALIAAHLFSGLAPADAAEALGVGGSVPQSTTPDAAIVATMFGAPDGVILRRVEEPVPGWAVQTSDEVIGYVGSTAEIARSVGYSGQPIDIHVAISRDAVIVGARLISHSEPILTLGLSSDDVARFVEGFRGTELAAARIERPDASDRPDVIARATVSSGVMRDAILRTARAMAIGHGLVGGAGIDRVSYRGASWETLVASGALAHSNVSLDDARAALTGARNPLPSGSGPFIELWAGLIDPPTIGRNLLGQITFSKIIATLGPGETALFVASRGLHSHRGTAWRRSGVFDRIAIVQGDQRIALHAAGYARIDRLASEGAPRLKERSIFRLPGEGFDPTRPFRIEVLATRKTAGDPVTMTIPIDYALPREFVLTAAEPPADEPLWIASWKSKRLEIAGVTLMLMVLAGFLFFQDAFVKRPALWRWGRIGFLSVTLVWLGWFVGGQLSVVQVVAFVHSLLSGFHWETFLIEPVIFLLWGFVALGLLFWGRGVFCGWLCPFGALQEITNEIAQRLGVPQIRVPFGLHERLWVIKYCLFVAILALSFYSMERALVLAEVEPFKTAITLHFSRAWPFVLFVGVLLFAGLFIERFYCRYLCPLGAGLAIPAKLKLFDWLRRRPQCGRECRLCEQRCTVGAIDPLGRINPNECVLCLRCQMIHHDPNTCIVLKRRTGRTAPAALPGAS